MSETKRTEIASIQHIAIDLKLSPKQRDFVKYFVESGGDRMLSLDRAGYQGKNRASKQVMITSLLKHPKITTAISRYQDYYLGEKKAIIEEDIYNVLRLRTKFDPRIVADAFEVETIAEAADLIRNMGESTAMAIEGITLKYWGKDNDKFTLELKFADKSKAIDQLIKLTGIAAPSSTKVDHTGTVTHEVIPFTMTVLPPATPPTKAVEKADVVVPASEVEVG